LIVGDDDFDAEHGVVDGSGTISDPYVIEGWDIDASLGCSGRSCAGIYVQNATASFVIRNISIHGGMNDGVRLSHVRNIRAESVSVALSGSGIHIASSTNVTLFGNTIVGSSEGVFLSESRNVYVLASAILSGTQGVVVERSSHIVFLGNVLSSNKANAFLLSDVTNSTLDSNAITDTAFRGIAMFNSSNIVASRNRIVGCGEQCLYILNGKENSVISNEVSRCEWAGVSVYRSKENTVRDNSVAATPFGVSLSDSSGNVVASNAVTNTSWGIAVRSDSDANYVLENTVTVSAFVGILLGRDDNQTPDRNVIQGNKISQSGRADLLDGSGGTDNLWQFNTSEKELIVTSE
jgi:parallel beta-helix repeat protein